MMAYIRAATVDVIYTDYVRLIHSYLPNVWSFEPYTHADVLTRMPINYIERMINVGIFGYSTTFDMLLGAFLADGSWPLWFYFSHSTSGRC